MSHKFIINGRFLVHRITGVERYAREIVSELDKLVPADMEISMAIPPEVAEIPSFKNIHVVKIGWLHNRMWEHISFPWYVRQQKAISLNLCNVAPLTDPGIVCIHDVKIKARPQDFSKKFIFWYKVLFWNETKHAKAILTDSEFSKREILKYYPRSSQKITVIPLAWQHYDRIGYDEGTLIKYGLQKGQYFYSMCSLEPNKNFRWIAEEARNHPDQIFAVAGSINQKVFSDGLGFERPKNMKLLGYVTDEEAKTLSRDCLAFLFPTFYEGFGIPPLEAMASGCHNIVVSDTEVMHEVFGNSVSYVNPEDPSVEIPIRTLNTDITLNKYSWEKSAELLLKVLKNIV